MRLLLAGWPRAGKSTLAAELSQAHGWPVRHTDDLIHLGWSEASAAAALWLDAPGPWIIEGVAVPRAVRKWLAAHPTGCPADEAHYLAAPYLPLSSGQAAMGRGCDSVWREVAAPLRARGVRVVDG